MATAVIGAGLTGLLLAYRLSQKGERVGVYEAEKIGGLVRPFKIENTYLEKYYHHIFKSDYELLALIEELGLTDQLNWYKSSVGLYTHHQIYPFISGFDLMRFSPLAFKERILLGLNTLKINAIKEWELLDQISVEEWFKQNKNLAAYQKVWEPLLRFKFGDHYKNISMSFLWGRITPRFRSRNLGGEVLGYMNNSFYSICLRLKEEIEKNGGKIMEDLPVIQVSTQENNQLLVQTKQDKACYQRVYLTLPLPVICQIVPELSKDETEQFKKVEYMNVATLIFILKKPLSKIYWLNIAEPGINIGGVIEHTNLVPSHLYNHKHIAYVFNYLPQGNELFEKDKLSYYQAISPSLKVLYPDWNENNISGMYFFKNFFGTPVYDRGYLNKKTRHSTSIKNLFIYNTAQIYPQDRNMNNSVVLTKEIEND